MSTVNGIGDAVSIQEEWRDVVGHVGYQVSDLGRVRSRWAKRGRYRYLGEVWWVTKLRTSGAWYIQANLSGTPRAVHILVLEAFAGPRPVVPDVKIEARHLNDVKTDNRLSNLVWGTSAENLADMRRNHIAHGSAKLSDRKVRRLRRLYATGRYFYYDLAPMFKVSTYTVGQIIRRETWTHI